MPLKPRERMANARPLMVVGVVLAVMEGALVLLWMGEAVYFNVQRVRVSLEFFPEEHLLFAFHFVATIALFSILEHYEVFGRHRSGDWNVSGSAVMYAASWGVAFSTALMTDVSSLVSVACNPVRGADRTLLQTTVCTGLALTVSEMAWSIAICSRAYFVDRKRRPHKNAS